jgi:hypothetical protein
LTIKVKGTGTGNYSLKITEYIDGKKSKADIYSNLPVTPALVGSLHIDDKGATTLQLDKNGDGTIDERRAPDSINTKQQLEDADKLDRGGIEAKPPQASLPSGVYATAQTLALSAPGWNLIYYTTDGSTPVPGKSKLFNGLVSVTSTTTLKAIGYLIGGGVSGIAQYSYTITQTCLAPNITSQPSNQAVSVGQNVSFTTAVNGNPTPTVKWQVAPNGSNTFIDIPGATGMTFNFLANTLDNGKKYRAVFTNKCGTATSNAATLTLVASPVLITEFRFSGSSGYGDWFVELYNNTDSQLSTNGRVIGFTNVSGTASISLALTANKMIPARGNYLVAGPNYSLGTLVTPDQSAVALPLANLGGVGIFNNSIAPANRVDSVGYNSIVGNASFAYFREGAGLLALGNTVMEHSWVRKMTADGLPQDTNNNQADFALLTPTGSAVNGVLAIMGVPGPQGLNSPLLNTALIPSLLFDPSASSTAPPNRERNTSPVPNGALGTLTIRRAFTNNTGAPVKKLRFRVIDITNGSTGSEAQLRVLSSLDVMINGKLVRGVTLEQPPVQPNGGGLNSTLAVGSITLASPLAAGASINVQFLLGVQRSGSFRFFVNVESLP